MKNKISMMLAGLMTVMAVTFSAGVLVPSATVFAANPMKEALDETKEVAGNNQELFGTNGIFNKVINAILFVLGAVSVLMLVYGGIRYTISGGDSGAVTSAKNTILYAVIGIVVAMLAYAIINFVVNRLS